MCQKVDHDKPKAQREHIKWNKTQSATKNRSSQHSARNFICTYKYKCLSVYVRALYMHACVSI